MNLIILQCMCILVGTQFKVEKNSDDGHNILSYVICLKSLKFDDIHQNHENLKML